MVDIKQLLGGVDANGLVGKMLGGMATKNFAAGLLTGGLASSLIKKDTVETVAKVGGLALLGTLAYKAYNNYQSEKQAGRNPNLVDAVKQSAQGMVAQATALVSGATQNTQAIAAPAALPANPDFPLAIMRVMIAAAKADGAMDDAESKKIMQHVESTGLTAEEKMLLMRELASTSEVATIAGAARVPEEAAQIYLAALLVCDSQCVREQEFLTRLAAALKLEPQFTQNLQQQLLSLSPSQAA